VRWTYVGKVATDDLAHKPRSIAEAAFRAYDENRVVGEMREPASDEDRRTDGLKPWKTGAFPHKTRVSNRNSPGHTSH